MKSRIRLQIITSNGFISIKTEEWDDKSLTEIKKTRHDKKLFLTQYVCQLLQTLRSYFWWCKNIIRANPFKGGTSEFISDNGDMIQFLMFWQTIIEKNGKIETNQSVKNCNQ